MGSDCMQTSVQSLMARMKNPPEPAVHDHIIGPVSEGMCVSKHSLNQYDEACTAVVSITSYIFGHVSTRD